MLNNTKKYIVASLYRFVSLPDYKELKPRLLEVCRENNVKGTLLLAAEGINGTVCATRKGIDGLISFLTLDVGLPELEYKESISEEVPFHRMKVKLKNEIVTMGKAGVNPSDLTGKYVEAKDWNRLIADPEVFLIDTRNTYECDIGKFDNAVLPDIDSFTEFPRYVSENMDPAIHKKVAMYCTGGIRCEKASAYLLAQGYEEVYQLHGGILKYLEEIKSGDSAWQGECFVFDGRVAVNETLQQGEYEQCFGCRRPVSVKDRKSEKYEYGVSCPACFADISDDKRQRLKERQKQVELAEKRNELHIGAEMDLKGKRAEGS